MNIWSAYCNKDYYNIYFDIMVAKGLSRNEVETIKSRYQYYIQRIKESPVRIELEECTNTDQFSKCIHELFEDTWAGYLKYKDIVPYFYDYLPFLDSMQALHNDYINEDEKKRLVGGDWEIPIPRLTHYETDFMQGGKLVALMNPQLLSFLKEFIEEDGRQPQRSAGLCVNFYGDLLPSMQISDYVKLITYLWSQSKRVKKGGKKNKLKITFPDNNIKIYSIFEGMKDVVLFYGEENIRQKKLKIRQDDLIVKHIPFGKENQYEKISSGYFLNTNGNTKDRQNVCNTINVLFGKKLAFELV